MTKTTEADLPFARRRARRAAALARGAMEDAIAAWRHARTTLDPDDLARARLLQAVATRWVHEAFVVAFEMGNSDRWPRTARRIVWSRVARDLTVPDRAGRCSRCGVVICGPRADRPRLLDLLAGHERFCPGGRRERDSWRPFAEPRRRARSWRRPAHVVLVPLDRPA